MTEAQLSLAIIKHLLREGVMAVKMSDRYHAGIPDIYYGRGCWIETKLHHCVGYFNPNTLPRPDQHRWMEKLVANHNKCTLLVGVQFRMVRKYWSTNYATLVDCQIREVDCHENLEVCLSSLPR